MAHFNEWFETFISEKNIPFASWEIESKGFLHLIDNQVVMEHVKVAPAGEQSVIKRTLVKIDFYNGDVNHFFEHLAQAIVLDY